MLFGVHLHSSGVLQWWQTSPGQTVWLCFMFLCHSTTRCFLHISSELWDAESLFLVAFELLRWSTHPHELNVPRPTEEKRLRTLCKHVWTVQTLDVYLYKPLHPKRRLHEKEKYFLPCCRCTPSCCFSKEMWEFPDDTRLQLCRFWSRRWVLFTGKLWGESVGGVGLSVLLISTLYDL